MAPFVKPCIHDVKESALNVSICVPVSKTCALFLAKSPEPGNGWIRDCMSYGDGTVVKPQSIFAFQRAPDRRQVQVTLFVETVGG